MLVLKLMVLLLVGRVKLHILVVEDRTVLLLPDTLKKFVTIRVEDFMTFKFPLRDITFYHVIYSTVAQTNSIYHALKTLCFENLYHLQECLIIAHPMLFEDPDDKGIYPKPMKDLFESALTKRVQCLLTTDDNVWGLPSKGFGLKICKVSITHIYIL